MSEVRLDDLTLAYGSHEVVSGVNLNVSAGTVLGLIGPNGSGKSTLLRAIYRLHRPTTGQVLIDGDDVWRMPARQVARRVAVMSQSARDGLEVTARTAVTTGTLPAGGLFSLPVSSREAVEEALHLTDTRHLANRRLETLSGGELQRVHLARALAQRPTVLLLDEPTNHLDPRHQHDLMALVSSLPMTIICVMHDLDLAAGYCDRIAVMHAGRLDTEGPTASMLDESQLAATFTVKSRYMSSLTYGTRLDHVVIDGPLRGRVR